MSSEVDLAADAPVLRGIGAPLSAALLAAWLLAGLLFATQVFVWGLLMGVAKPWWQCIVVTLPDLAIWAGVIPLAAALSRRVPPRSGEWPRAAAFHLPLAFLLSGGAVALHVALAAALGWVDDGGITELLRLRLALHLPTGMVVYAVVVAAAEILRGRDRGATAPESRPDLAGDAAAAAPGASRKVAVPVEDGTRLLDAGEIDWIEADRNYSILHVGDDSERIRESLGSLEERLGLVRIHKSTLVNLDRVERVHRWRHGDFLVELEDGTRLRLSRSYRGRFEERLGTRV